jgi:hypothetical protein
MNELTPAAIERLENEKNIWVATLRPAAGGQPARPHLAPVWFAYFDGKLYISIEAKSVKGRNLARSPRVTLALEEGTHPVICEGTARPAPEPWPPEVVEIFLQKYEWDIQKEQQYNQLLEITPQKWLTW